MQGGRALGRRDARCEAHLERALRLVRRSSESFMSRALIGRERTRARKTVASLACSDPAEVARRLGMRRHTVAAILSRRMLPGRTFAERAARMFLSL
jgi:DNA-binding CsgD family transcriptional regulator